MRLSICVLLVLFLATPADAGAGAKRRPNIVILLADDMGFADAGFQGCKDIPTPNLDSLSQRGVRFTSGYVSGPYCSPTRAGLLTGRYQTRFGHEFNPGGGDTVGLPLTEATLADRLKAAGYVTGLVGKWHLGSGPNYQPQRRGFDEFFGFLGGADSYFADKGPPILRGTDVVEEKAYLTDAFGEAVAFIDRHKEQPFFLYLAFNAVHTPMHATDARLQKFNAIENKTRRTYAAMLWAMDEAVGQVLAKLTAAGLEEDTLIFFFSDNGGPVMPGTTINGSSNTPLRGSKRTTLEGGIRVPWVIAWKGKLPAGKVYDQPIIQLDVLPTALAAAEVAVDEKCDGVNLVPHLTGAKEAAPHETLYWRSAPKWPSAPATGFWSAMTRAPTAANRRRRLPRRAFTTWPRILAKRAIWPLRNQKNSASCNWPGTAGTWPRRHPCGRRVQAARQKRMTVCSLAAGWV